MTDCRECKFEYYSDKDPDTICESKCSCKARRLDKDEEIVYDLFNGCRHFKPKSN